MYTYVFSLSPSRVMSVMDPLLNTGFLWRCLAAYAGIKFNDHLSNGELSASSNRSSPEQNRKNGFETPPSTQGVVDNEDVFENIESDICDTYYMQLGNANLSK